MNNNRKNKRKNTNLPSTNDQVQAYVKKLQFDAKSKDGKIFEDPKNRRVVSKELLYDYIDLDRDYEDCDDNIFPTQPSWTDSHWKRANIQGQTSNDGPKPKLKNLPMNKLEKKLIAAVAQPVESSKASSMMMKMGWRGGPLGKTGTGIVEPIVPNVAYATKTIGFGVLTKEKMLKPKKQTAKQSNNQMKKKEKKGIQREILITNALKVILQFAKNPREVQILFDPRLFNTERQIIHTVVNDLINNDIEEGSSISCDSEQQVDLLEKIGEYNNYIMKTQSEGKHPKRILCISKKAPSFVYLVTPEDLRGGLNDDHDDEYDDYDQIDDESELYDVSDGENIEMATTANVNVKTKSVDAKITNNDNKMATNDCITVQNDKVIQINTKPDVGKHNKHSLPKNVINSNKDVINQVNITENERKTDDKVNKNEEKELKTDKIDVKVNANSSVIKNYETITVCVKEIEDNQTKFNNDKSDDSKCGNKKILNTATDKISNSNIPDADKQSKLLNAITIIDPSVNNPKEDKDNVSNVENENIDIIDTLIDYFKEFSKDTAYTEFRFLGEFNDDEVEKINEFITSLHNSVNGNVDSRYEGLMSCLDKKNLFVEVKTDLNGGIVIHKIPKF